MTKYRTFFTIAVSAAIVLAIGVSAEAVLPPDDTKTVTASATVTGVATMSVSPSAITFGTTSADAFPTQPAEKKIVINYSSNYGVWKIMIYTMNTQVPDYDPSLLPSDPLQGKYQKGGLATADGKNVIACKWVAKAPASLAPEISTIGGYNFIKDTRDQDDPATATFDESWTAAFDGGYADIAYGGPGYGVCVDPTKSPDYRGDAISGSLAVYVAGGFGTGFVVPSVPAPAGAYSSGINFSLYHE